MALSASLASSIFTFLFLTSAGRRQVTALWSLNLLQVSSHMGVFPGQCRTSLSGVPVCCFFDGARCFVACDLAPYKSKFIEPFGKAVQMIIMPHTLTLSLFSVCFVISLIFALENVE